MSNSSLLNRAAIVLRSINPTLPADAALRKIFAENHHWSPEERRQIVRAVFSFFRWYQWLGPKDAFQTQLSEALALQERFEKNPSNIKVQALAARAVPEWLAAEMDLGKAYLQQLQSEPALWLRPRLGREGAVEAALEDVQRVELEDAPGGLRFSALRYNGRMDLFRTEAFRKGLFEIQDLASQWVGHLCAPKPGETWWDACSGEGGKTLHLADLMQGKGLLWASDRSARRLERLKERAARAEVFNYRVAAWEGDEKLPTKTQFDGILLDAPCSGVGTWRRNPHARWTTGPEDVRELAEVQLRLLGHVCTLLKPGGRLVYTVCTLTRSETTAVSEAFSAAHPEYQKSWDGVFPPEKYDSNGMYACVWTRKTEAPVA